MQESARSYARPYRPRALRAVNALLDGAARMGAEPAFDEAAIVASARKQARRDVFADDAWRVPLRRLLDAAPREARLHPVGRLILRRILAGHLANRLRIEALVDLHPEIEDTQVAAPLFIVGLQRTGTTHLQRMLASHPQLRGLAAWEAVTPAPLRDARPGEEDPRIPIARLAEKSIRYMAPDFFAIHPVIAEGHEEDSLLFDPSLMTTTAEALMNVPSFTAWLESADHAPAFREYRRVLQALLWQRPGRWLGKTPLFLEHLDTLLATFPDALVIHTHRDPSETVASLCSMLSHGRGVFSDEVDPHEVGSQWLAKTRRMVDRGMASRRRIGEGAFLDVDYRELVSNPLKQVQRICEFAGLDYDEEIERQMRRFLGANPQHKHGRHSYALSDFGLSEADVEEAYGAYRSHYGLG